MRCVQHFLDLWRCFTSCSTPDLTSNIKKIFLCKLSSFLFSPSPPPPPLSLSFFLPFSHRFHFFNEECTEFLDEDPQNWNLGAERRGEYPQRSSMDPAIETMAPFSSNYSEAADSIWLTKKKGKFKQKKNPSPSSLPQTLSRWRRQQCRPTWRSTWSVDFGLWEIYLKKKTEIFSYRPAFVWCCLVKNGAYFGSTRLAGLPLDWQFFYWITLTERFFCGFMGISVILR